MKLYEYGAAGLPALARRTRELDRRRDPFVHLFSNEEEAARELEILIGQQPDRRAIADQMPEAWLEGKNLGPARVHFDLGGRQQARRGFARVMRLPRLLGLAVGLMLTTRAGADDHVGVCTHFDQGWNVAEIMPMVADLGVGWIRDGVRGTTSSRRRGATASRPGRPPGSTRRMRIISRSCCCSATGTRFTPIRFHRRPTRARRRSWPGVWPIASTAIEVLNEPNNPDFGPTYGGKWNGKEDDGSVSPYVRAYVKVLSATVAAVKKANPHMLVVGYGAPAPATFRMIALGPPPLLDGITDHPYSGGRKLPELIPYAATPDLLQRDGIATADAQGTYRSQCAMFRAQAAKYGLHAALWNTEWGYSTALPPNEKEDEVVSPNEQAIYVLRRLLEARALGVMSFYYLFRDDGGDIHRAWQNLGLVDINLKPKPAFYAFQRFTRDFADAGRRRHGGRIFAFSRTGACERSALLCLS